LTNNDGCSSACTLEISFFCVDVAINSGTANQSSCSPCMSNCYNCTNITICIQCGTNYVFNTTSSSCTIDCSSITYCVTCTYTSTLNCQSCSVGYYILGSSCVPRCGDGIMTIEEGCDDGNTANNDGCSPACALEPSFFYCNNQTSNVSSINNMSSCFPCLANC
jgi:cysteine-rich repeat protein